MLAVRRESLFLGREQKSQQHLVVRLEDAVANADTRRDARRHMAVAVLRR